MKLKNLCMFALLCALFQEPVVFCPGFGAWLKGLFTKSSNQVDPQAHQPTPRPPSRTVVVKPAPQSSSISTHQPQQRNGTDAPQPSANAMHRKPRIPGTIGELSSADRLTLQQIRSNFQRDPNQTYLTQEDIRQLDAAKKIAARVHAAYQQQA